MRRRGLVFVALIVLLMAGAASAFVAVTGTVALRVREPLFITNAFIQNPRFGANCTIADDRLSTTCSADQFAGESGRVVISLANQGSAPILVHLAATSNSPDVTLSFPSPGPDRTVEPQGPGQPPVDFEISVRVSQGAAPGPVTITAQFMREHQPTPTPTTPPSALPISTDLFISTSAGLANQLDSNDVFKVVFSEAMGPDSTGDMIRVQDSDGTTMTIRCDASTNPAAGDYGAVCNFNAASETVKGTDYEAARVLTVTITGSTAPTATGQIGSTPGMQLPTTVIDQGGIRDASPGDQWNVTDSPDRVIDME